MYEIDEQQIRQWWQLFKYPNRLAEVRLLGGNNRSYSGYFKDANTLITQLKPYLAQENEKYYGKLQVYCIFNDINEALYGREQKDKFVKGEKSTKDDDMTKRNFVLVDLDPKRVSGVSASDSEFEAAHKKAVDVYKYLLEKGFNEPIIAISGNGYHIYLPCDMPSDEKTHTLVNNFLKALGMMFTDDKVDVDQSVGNVANLTKMVGTWAKKGSDGEERKWRMARFVKIPQEIKINETSLFQKIADLVPKEEPKVAPNRQRPNYGNNTPFDLRTWLNEHAIVYKEEPQGSGTKFVLEHCPWEDTHSNRQSWDSALFQDADGSIKFHCFHSHCNDKTWFDFRLFYEPNAYDKPAYQPQQVVYVQQPFQSKRKYEIKAETNEIGKKWFSMSDIEKVDLSAIPRFRTGINEMDKLILGLAECEVTLLSGGNASGKTSFINTLVLNAINQGVPSAIYSGELPPYILKAWIQMVAAGRLNLRPSQYNDGKFFVPNYIAERIDQWLEGKLFLFNNEYGNNFDELMHDSELLLDMGVRFFVFDNLMSMDIDLLEGDKNNRQKSAILRIKEFSKKNRCHVLLVAHPRKSLAFLRKNDISGTSDLTNTVDNVWIAHRVNQDFLKAGADFYGQTEIHRYSGFGTVIEICKNRMYGVCDSLVGMHYEIESRRFKNTLDEDIHYAWEQIPTEQRIDFVEPKKIEQPKPQASVEPITEQELLTQREAPF